MSMSPAQIVKRAALSQRSLFLVAVGSVVAYVAGLAAFPASFWFEVRNVRVADTVAGATPLMAIDREIRRPFEGEWTVTVLRKRQDGEGFFSFCTAKGAADYHPSNRLPQGPDLTLDWWIWPTKCPLPPGLYKIRTHWLITARYFPTKEVWNDSNEFRVFPL